jgi:acyl carrier protein
LRPDGPARLRPHFRPLNRPPAGQSTASNSFPTALPASIELTAALRYTGNQPAGGGNGASFGRDARNAAAIWIYLQYIKGLVMSSTFDQVATIIAETCDIPRDTITPDSHAIDDLGIDSLDFLDIAFAIDKAFGIKLPLEKWTQEVNDGKATTEQYFVLKNLCARIDELVAAKGAGA